MTVPLRGTVVRHRLLRRLLASTVVPLVTVVAPAGYGKTTLVERWAQRDARGFVWVALTARDNDPTVFSAHVGRAISARFSLDIGDYRAPGAGPAQPADLIRRLLRTGQPPGVVVFDDAGRLTSAPSRLLLAEAVAALPAGWQAAVLSRTPFPQLSTARRALAGEVLDLRLADLALDQEETALLASEAGCALSRDAITALLHRTEGWPAVVGMVLGAAVVAEADLGGGGVGDVGVVEGAGDRLVAEYLHGEVLSSLPDDDVAFLRRTSVVEPVSGLLCDAVLDSGGSAARLEALATGTGLVLALSERESLYRYHRVLRTVLQADLERHEPELIATLRGRASDWYTDHDEPELAAEQAMAAEDTRRMAQVLGRHGQALSRRGEVATVDRWLAWLDRQDVAGMPLRAALVGAWSHLVAGRGAAAQRWIDRASLAATSEEPAERAPQGVLLALRAALCRDGVEAMRVDARAAVERLVVTNPWWSTALLVLGIAEMLAGDSDQADVVLAEAIDAAADAGASYAGTIALAERALLALERGDGDAATALAERALAGVVAAGLADAPLSAVVYAAVARARFARADVPRGREATVVAQRLRPHLTHALPHLAVQVRLHLAWGAIAQADAVGARTVLREANDILVRRPRLGVLVEQAEHLRTRLEALRADMVGATSLTAAELRLLPLLATHLSFQDIGARLDISRNTVKTEALSIYRKLGVSSRGAAIGRAEDLGLLGH